MGYLENNVQHIKTDVIQHSEFLPDSGYFVYNNNYYIEMIKCTIGSKLSPILSLYVIVHLFNICIPKLPFKLPFMQKFVDDILYSTKHKDVNTKD